MKPGKIMPPTYLLAAMFVMFILHFVFPLTNILPGYWKLFGLLPLVAGIGLNLIADGAFHRAKTTVRPFEKSSTLVTDSIYQFTRNPMYLGFILILFGIASLLGSLTPFLVVIAFAILLDRGFVRREEQMLAKKFDPKWQTYQARVRRWL